MIRRARPADKSAIFNIWRVCFGDSGEYINFFLDNGFDAASCLVFEEDGKAVSMLHILNAEYKTFSAVLPVQYIYAAATLPEFQGRGIMKHLLEAAEESGAENGCAFTWLLPGSASLYNYYAKLSYKTAFYIKKAHVSRDRLKEIASADFENTKKSSSDIYNLRKKHFCPAVLWKKREFNYALSEHEFTGGKILRFKDSYALCRNVKGTVEMRETTGSVEETAAALLSHYDSSSFTFLFPSRTEMPFPSETLKYGMLKPCRGNSGIFEEVTGAEPYVNLMLD